MVQNQPIIPLAASIMGHYDPPKTPCKVKEEEEEDAAYFSHGGKKKSDDTVKAVKTQASL
jgi:hypothetical protein